MKILQVLDSFYPNLDGPNESMVNISKKLCEQGHTVELLVPKYPEIVEVDGLKIHRCFSVPSNEDYRAALPQFDRSVKKLIKNGGVDIIHLQSPFILSKYALKLGKKYGIPVVFTMRTKFKEEFKNRLKSRLLVKFMMGYIMRCINGCTVVTAVSRGTVDVLREYGYKRCGSVRVIGNATGMLPLSADQEITEKIVKEYGLENNFTFMFAGRLAEVKNVQLSLSALSIVKKRGYGNFRFLIVGDGAYGKTLKKKASELGLTENVIFTGKITDKKLLASYYAAADILLFPSAFDTFGLVVLEAAANATPTVALKGSCASERIEDGVSGFVWEDGAERWAENIIKILDNPATAEFAGEGALKYVYESWDGVSKQYSKLYNELLCAEKK